MFSNTIRSSSSWYVRPCPPEFLVGQQCPLYEVPSPNSKRATIFVRDFLLVGYWWIREDLHSRCSCKGLCLGVHIPSVLGQWAQTSTVKDGRHQSSVSTLCGEQREKALETVLRFQAVRHRSWSELLGSFLWRDLSTIKPLDERIYPLPSLGFTTGISITQQGGGTGDGHSWDVLCSIQHACCRAEVKGGHWCWSWPLLLISLLWYGFVLAIFSFLCSQSFFFSAYDETYLINTFNFHFFSVFIAICHGLHLWATIEVPDNRLYKDVAFPGEPFLLYVKSFDPYVVVVDAGAHATNGQR